MWKQDPLQQSTGPQMPRGQEQFSIISTVSRNPRTVRGTWNRDVRAARTKHSHLQSQFTEFVYLPYFRAIHTSRVAARELLTLGRLVPGGGISNWVSPLFQSPTLREVRVCFSTLLCPFLLRENMDSQVSSSVSDVTPLQQHGRGSARGAVAL